MAERPPPPLEAVLAEVLQPALFRRFLESLMSNPTCGGTQAPPWAWFLAFLRTELDHAGLYPALSIQDGQICEIGTKKYLLPPWVYRFLCCPANYRCTRRQAQVDLAIATRLIYDIERGLLS